MDDQFDKDLTGRIREVFEDYAYPPADDGWEALRKKFPAEEKKNKIAWLWWGSAAAVLLVFLGIGTWLLNPQQPVNNVAKNNPVKAAIKDSAINSLTGAAAAKDKLAATRPGRNTIGEAPVAPINGANSDAAMAMHEYQRNVHSLGIAQPVSRQTAAQNYRYNKVEKQAIAAIPEKISTNPATVTLPDVVNEKAIEPNNTNEPQLAKNEQPAAVKSNSAADNPQPHPPAKSIMELLQGENKNVVAKKIAATKQDVKRVNFSVYAATYINYASGSANQVNAGAGFTSDIRLNNNFKISTGVSLAQNTLRYDNAPPTRDGGVAYASAVALSKDAGFASSYSVPVFQNYSARLVGLDIPVNIKYEFNPQKNDTYISAGLSSGTFIDERYTASYLYRNNVATANGNVVSNTTTIKTNDENASKSFNSFYFGKTLNVSFGLGYPLGKSNRLIIEPFLKYPLDGLGTQQLRFGAGGLNLKVNFTRSKK